LIHTAVYNAPAAGVNAVNTDLAAAADTILTTRNSHLIFTDPWQLLAIAMVGASVTRGRLQSPTLNAIGEFALFNANRALQPPSNPQWDFYLPMPVALPQSEELQVQVSNNLGASTEIENAILQLATPGHTYNLPQGGQPYLFRATVTVTPTLNAWSGGQAIVFSQNPRGGVYSLIGSIVQGSNAVAHRWLFPRARLFNGRALRPGGLNQNAVGDVVVQAPRVSWDMWGEMGRFHTFEPPQLEVFGTAAVSTTYQIFMHCVYLGGDQNALDAWARSAAA
jgi:hypothetical protein